MNEEHLNTLKTKIGILGIGAIGTVIAYQLQHGKSYDLLYFSRTPKQLLKLHIENNFVDIPIHIITTLKQSHRLNWLIICLKEHQFQEARPWFSKLITAKTSIVVIRNGLQLKPPLIEFTNSDNILECMIDCPIQIGDDGFYHCLQSPVLTIPNGDLSYRFKSLFTSNTEIQQVENFKTQSWKKLCESATLGAILCLHNDTCHIFANEQIQVEYTHLMNECIAVAKADGAIIEEGFTERMLSKILRYPAHKGSSMLSDMRQGKPIEFGAKNGIISQIGKQYHIPTPLNDAVKRRLT